jgi:NitT/TauT family transport system substrate-binding protein
MRSIRPSVTFLARTAGAAAALLAAAGAHADSIPLTLAIGTTSIDASQANNTSVPVYTKCWEKEGLNVTIQPANSGAAVQAVLSGQAHFANLGPGNALQARAKGAPIKAVYVNIRKNFQFPVVLENSPIKSIQDFKGKTIGVISYGAVTVQIIKAQLAEAGLDPNKDVTFIETGTGAQAVTALTSGKVDIWGTWDSQIATAENMGVKLRKFTSQAADKLSFGSSFFARDDFIKSQPQAIEKFLRCLVFGTQVTMANPEGAIRAHWQVYPASKPTGIDEATAMKQALHLVNTRLDYLKIDPGQKYGEMTLQQVTDMIEFMRKNDQLPGKLDPADAYTNQFIDAANRVDPAAVKAAAESLPKK